jgi:tetratricopeptide (TPR) repeat protein
VEGLSVKAASNRAAAAMALVSACLMVVSCSRNPEKAKANYLALGQIYMKKGQYGDAAIEFRNAVHIDPRFAEAYYQLAQADLAQHNWNAAYASLERALDLDPTRLDADLDRGRLYLAARQFAHAEADQTTTS